jgi:hypothetical protein
MAVELHRVATQLVPGFSELVDQRLPVAAQCGRSLVASGGEGAAIDPAGDMTCDARSKATDRLSVPESGTDILTGGNDRVPA